MESEFSGKVVVITGAAGIYGEQFAGRFARLGAQLFLTDRDEERLQAVERRLCAKGNVQSHVADLTSAHDLDRLCSSVVERFGPPNIVINNAGIYPFGGLFDTSLATFD